MLSTFILQLHSAAGFFSLPFLLRFARDLLVDEYDSD